jgi:hypothetical protein
MNQTVPVEIHLFVSEEPFLLDQGFPNKQIWPELEKLPIQIHWVPNWGCYRKTVSFMKMFPNETFLAVDDDEEFHPLFLKMALEFYKKAGCSTMAFRATAMNENTYNHWPSVREPGKSVRYWHKGNGGVIYDSSLFQKKDFFDYEVFLKIAATSDDVWMNLWRMKLGAEVYVLPIDHKPMPQEERLWFYNADKNDLMIEAVKNWLEVLRWRFQG